MLSYNIYNKNNYRNVQYEVKMQKPVNNGTVK